MVYLLIAISFLLGSIPFGIIVGKYNGVDLRKTGSGNIGATNALRAIGKKAGIITLLADIAKGTIAVHLPVFFFPNTPELASLMGFTAIVGHCYSPFVNFKGGKGVATSLGVFLALSPLNALFAAVVFFLIVKTTERVSLGSMLSAIAFALLTGLPANFELTNPLFLSALLTSLLIIYRHHENIRRLIAGTEPSYKKKASPEELSK